MSLAARMATTLIEVRFDVRSVRKKVALMIEVHFYHQSIQAVVLPTIIFGRLCTTSPDLLQSGVLLPINIGLGGPDGTRKTSEDVEQGSSGCRPGLPCQDPLAHQEQGHLPPIG